MAQSRGGENFPDTGYLRVTHSAKCRMDFTAMKKDFDQAMGISNSYFRYIMDKTAEGSILNYINKTVKS